MSYSIYSRSQYVGAYQNALSNGQINNTIIHSHLATQIIPKSQQSHTPQWQQDPSSKRRKTQAKSKKPSEQESPENSIIYNSHHQINVVI